MGYVILPGGTSNFSKAVLSLWFRVPAATIAAATAEYAADLAAPGAIPIMSGVIPLMTFGLPNPQIKALTFPAVATGDTSPTLKFKFWSTTTCDWAQGDPDIPGVAVTTSQWVLGDDAFDDEPSFIAVDCTGDNPALSVNIQMADNGTFGGSYPIEIGRSGPSEYTKYSGIHSGGGCTPPPTKINGTPVPFNTVTYDHTYGSGAQAVLSIRKERFRTLPEQFRSSEGRTVTADDWHHLLLSFDLTSPNITEGHLDSGGGTVGDRTTSACQMWISFDDVNLTGVDLSSFWPDGYADTNAILSVNAYNQAAALTTSISNSSGDDDFGNTIVNNYTGFSKPTCSYTPTAIRTSGYPIGIPATSTWVGKIRTVEMAEMQLFTGVSIDTGVEDNRRAFVTADGTPETNYAAANELMGKNPEIRLHGTTNWQSGRNTGTAGNLSDTGTIDPFTPGPSFT